MDNGIDTAMMTVDRQLPKNKKIIKLVKAGRHGRKTGRGIYEYDDKGAKIPNSGVRPF